MSGTRTLTSDLATAYLSDDGARVETLEMRGRSRITGVGDGVGAIRAMESDDVNLEFAEDGRTLRGATLSSAKPNRATIDVGTTDSGERRVAGQWIDVRIAPDGTTVTSLTVRDDVELALPATKDGPARTVRASALTAKGEAGKPLNGARFLDAVEFRETRTGVAARIVRSRSLDILTQPGFGAIDDAHFVGSVRFEADQLRATAGEARYLVTKGVVDLTGLDETTGQPPRVTDGQVTIDARRLEITLEGSKIHAQQDVRSIMASATQSPSKGAEGKTRRAGMLKQDQPVFATGADLTYDSVARLAVYTAVAPAQARLWQGDTAIQGARIEVDDAKGNLSAKGKVASTLQLDQGDAAPAKADHVATIASADELLYEDASRKTTYSGTAHVAGTNGDVRAAKVELYLKPAGNELERVEAYTTVSMVDATRTATGDRLTYLTETGRYLMSGAPVKLVADCRETTGRILTFFKSTNNIIVDPNDETRTQTKPVPGCVPAGRN
ncbi:MAG: hypothetical protein NTY02_11770 [Acidobacteria bacterium]|nr:hypothetical protein [Acidobacteriota bacterium]